MKFIISRNLLEETLQNVSKGLSNKTPMPVLMGIKITAETDKLTFITTNKEISIKIVLPSSNDLQILENGYCVVPGKYFVDIVKKIDSDKVDFTLFDERTIKIVSSKSDFTLVAYEKNNFPQPVFEIESETITLSCKDIKQINKQVGFVCPAVDARIVLTSLNFTIDKNSLTVIATDSYRLSRKITNIDGNFDKLSINVPAKSIDELCKIIPDSNDKIDLIVSNNQALFKFKNILFLTRLVEGVYVNTNNFFPKNNTLSVKFNRSEFISAVDRASLFANSTDLNVVRLSIYPYESKVEITSASSEIGRVLENVTPLEMSSGQDLQLSFSSKNLLEALKSFETDTITLNFAGEIKPLTITSEQNTSLTQLLSATRTF